jgi:hypothetical protein
MYNQRIFNRSKGRVNECVSIQKCNNKGHVFKRWTLDNKNERSENMTKHFNKFISLHEQLSLVGALVSNDEMMLSLLRSMW